MKVIIGKKSYPLDPDVSLLDTLLDAKLAIPYSCKTGVCHSCLIRCLKGKVPKASQLGLKDTLLALNYVKACCCFPLGNMTLSLAKDAELFGRAVVVTKRNISKQICIFQLEPSTPLYYRAGQFINLRRSDGLTRSYSLASIPAHQGPLEIHVQRMKKGEMSNWLLDSVREGDEFDIQGPFGECFFTNFSDDESILMIGTGTGLAPLLGIIRDALDSGYKGSIHLYHGSSGDLGLYCHRELSSMVESFPNITYYPCISGGQVPEGSYITGRASDIAFNQHQDLSDFRVYLCGNPDMVKEAQLKAFLNGAEMQHIYVDPFSYKDNRTQSRF